MLYLQLMTSGIELELCKQTKLMAQVAFPSSFIEDSILDKDPTSCNSFISSLSQEKQNGFIKGRHTLTRFHLILTLKIRLNSGCNIH